MRAAAKRIMKALTLAAFAAAVLCGAVWASGADNGGQAGRDDKKGITGVAPYGGACTAKIHGGRQRVHLRAIEGIEYAQKLGIRIVNCGWSGEDENEGRYGKLFQRKYAKPRNEH